ncbi:unnamed protein product [Mesocestoides corti]|uniref:C2H2-type domain-containing protein n=1 Tax=Mesocestoides corti TaxID=53468 RepID=A0A0R3UHU4_MESCO|nr:unnamed protein product [Mesocestoides corti]
MPSGPMSTMTSAATVIPAPPGVFATSMPPDSPSSASPLPSTEDRDSVSSNESHRRRSMVNGGRDDEKSPILPSGLADSFTSEHRNRAASPVSDRVNAPAPKPPDYVDDRSLHKRDASTSTVDCGTITEPDLLGPCEPGSKIVLEGVVWLETPGMMVINAHWRGRAYLGTLLDASRNTLGPSCPDKMISSLSMVRSRPHWGGSASSLSSSNPYRNSVNCSASSSTGIPSATSGTIKTRSAIAAAEDPASQRRRALQVSVSGGRGRKRRRGGMAPSSSTTSLSTNSADPTSTHLDEQDDEATTSTVPSDTPSAPEFACPQPGCEKRFSDILGVRFHLDMSHGQQQKQEPKSSGESVEIEVDNIYSQTSEPPEPPQLAKFKSSCGSSFSLEVLDEDPPPPQLDRGPSADEMEPSVVPMCEPPAASPAYSDISDDGPAPQKGRATGDGSQQGWGQTTASQSQPIDWSGRRGGVPTGNSPYDFATPPQQTTSNGLPLSSFGTGGAGGGSPYHHHHHHHRPPLHVRSSAPTPSEKLLQAHLVNLMTAGASSTGQF